MPRHTFGKLCGHAAALAAGFLSAQSLASDLSLDALVGGSRVDSGELAPFSLDFGNSDLSLALLAQDEASTAASGGGSNADLAKKLQNPVAGLISVPFQYNIDFGIGPDDGTRSTLNVQPVIPISLNEDWNVISRTIAPIIYQDDVVPGDGSQFGLGDITQSFFFSPKKPGPSGWIWGAGPAFLIPTATESVLGSEKFGIGPTAVLLRQQSGWTYGALVNHIVSVAGNDDRAYVNSTFLQPFLTYTTSKAFTIGINTESTYDWNGEQWTVPINLFASQVLKLGDQRLSVSFGGRYYAERPDGGPDWGLRFVVTLLFPD